MKTNNFSQTDNFLQLYMHEPLISLNIQTYIDNHESMSIIIS